ncbi:type IV toxin-antitoxin system AbiEi family antitoxin domain-containing protein [Pyxidicoccus sp. MSG2]|uniref:type IV toxin-antitoxin system AbiEi family antitoxin domain-containing protein n=1 Tax=Pyxidicoccus sp. MSG2 TaxID=2996790 RepID=UPI00226D466E|nr:type IV toxin-antitoxin system AbiEi family antitoxin domain-containing protein [Pyxidicoccus sp. MSG2]MCY1017735.1 type IV toxin-antitoxin system AbiEi family antitoxin domain-containing protein [Pyxidicoccus sp. MSG2]
MSPSRPPQKAFEREVRLIQARGGVLRMSEVLRLGISRRALYGMRDAGVLDTLGRGLYRLSRLAPLGHPDLVTIATRVPRGVICLVSALSFHELTTEVPHVVDVALERGARHPRVDHPPTRFFWFSGAAFHEGIESHVLDGREVHVYGPEKTLADCFKYRNKVGMDVTLEALRLWRSRRRKHLPALLLHGRQCRVEKVMRPYLEALI